MNATPSRGEFISSKDIEGCDVYSETSHEKIGVIGHLIIDKVSGNVAYADMSFDGLWGIGEKHQLIPWRALVYDTVLDGFVTAITESQVNGAPRPSSTDIFDPTWEERLHKHYCVRGYWDALA